VEAHVNVITLAVDDLERALVFYREQLTVRDGLIKSSNFIADMSAFMALVNPAERGSA
jgi:catechol 2,3-dioxygenase-like lactoylglutathione lyase family enzyme